ncbi:MAG: ATP-binding cassette domain-containing protein, partial [Lachnospiraceae bacterium]|nr:ATP-binding cassette domain-containing protein [Lachnospiraceae bacterium]
MNILTVNEITKAYGERKIFDKASFYLQEGEKAGVIGINGTGKSTTLSLISGINKPYRGSVKIFGKSHKEFGNGLFDGVLGVLPQNPQ